MEVDVEGRSVCHDGRRWKFVRHDTYFFHGKGKARRSHLRNHLVFDAMKKIHAATIPTGILTWMISVSFEGLRKCPITTRSRGKIKVSMAAPDLIIYAERSIYFQEVLNHSLEIRKSRFNCSLWSFLHSRTNMLVLNERKLAAARRKHHGKLKTSIPCF